MSLWISPKDEDIDVVDNKEAEIWVMENNDGNVYITLTFDQICDMYDKITEHTYKEG